MAAGGKKKAGAALREHIGRMIDGKRFRAMQK